jgi:hypothetical protein
MMATILSFLRNRCTSVEPIDAQTMRAVCRLQDPLLEAYVEILVGLPDLEIIKAGGQIIRSVREAGSGPVASLQNVIGIRIGPGLRKILKGVMGKSEIEKQLTFMVEECCNGVILSFTKEMLVHVPKDKSKEREYFENRVRSNSRLYNSCAALASGSPLVEGIERPE